MEIKFGNLVLCDWKPGYDMHDPVKSYRPIIWPNGDRSTGVVIMRGFSERFTAYFQYDLVFLHDIFGYPEFDNDEVWIQNHVDDFLIRMSKLKAFL